MDKITSRHNPLCVHIKKLGTDRVYRTGHGEALCDGIKLLEEAVNNSAEIINVLTSAHIPFPLPAETRVFYADRNLINSISPLKNAQDILFTCKIPPGNILTDISGTCILLDSIQDPGNIGTVIRTAKAFGVACVILTGGCADPYNPKAIRASMGAIYTQKICFMSTDELMLLYKNGARFIGACPGTGLRSISDVRLDNAVIVTGNEGRGISGEILELCRDIVTIPMSAGCESLNAAAAAAILMWEAVRERA